MAPRMTSQCMQRNYLRAKRDHIKPFDMLVKQHSDTTLRTVYNPQLNVLLFYVQNLKHFISIKDINWEKCNTYIFLQETLVIKPNPDFLNFLNFLFSDGEKGWQAGSYYFLIKGLAMSTFLFISIFVQNNQGSHTKKCPNLKYDKNDKR